MGQMMIHLVTLIWSGCKFICGYVVYPYYADYNRLMVIHFSPYILPLHVTVDVQLVMALIPWIVLMETAVKVEVLIVIFHLLTSTRENWFSSLLITLISTSETLLQSWAPIHWVVYRERTLGLTELMVGWVILVPLATDIIRTS